MKTNLTTFVSELASELELRDWDLDPNPEAPGGRVIIVEGNMADDIAIYQRLAAEALTLGNFPVDLLACVPPNLVKDINGQPTSMPALALRKAGLGVWDAVSTEIRDQFPTDKSALRIVQYDSCRGLEGWTVINYGFDALWDYKYAQCMTSDQQIRNLFDTPEEAAATFAARWAMIPLTRAMDTLVINVSSTSSSAKSALKRIHARRSDFVEWLSL